MKWYKKVLSQYTDFKGRSRRQEFWMFVLFNFIFAFIAAAIDNILGLAYNDNGTGPISLIYGLAVLIPGLAVAVRRLHDIGKSGIRFG
ncbi:DUF805 domain-containing protein [Pseudotamlana carrageenivorans]|uniref:DUF805 domain-containing protein n=1 Tax=Pseudotamlana carrageenivorans TaxID=2069432 RepID=A0A2I7SFY5_9FLAO|nr:DUF805 domain-containing protein [Tamlana carrageenivorans]AUS04795.1 hypothetical protein C1A40_04585 [Tamlana carrageenivorans]